MNKININTFKHSDWTKIWDGGWSFLSCSHFGEEYTKEILFGGKPFQSQSIILTAKGRSSGWMRQSDRDKLGKYLAGQVKSKKDAMVIAGRLKKQAKSFLAYIAKYENTSPTLERYQDFWLRLCRYYKRHINVKYVVDYLEPKLLQKYLPIFQDARLAAEPVLNRTEDLIYAFAKFLGKKTGCNYKLLLCLTKWEMEKC